MPSQATIGVVTTAANNGGSNTAEQPSDYSSCFKLGECKNIIRTNPMSDFLTVKDFHHAEFWCADATNAARRFSWGLGMPITAKSDLSTGNSVHASYLLGSGDVKILFTAAPYSPSISIPSTATIPTFSITDHRAFASSHGLAVSALAIEVADAFSAFSVAVSRGAKPVHYPVSLDNSIILAELQLYGDVVLRLISYKQPENSKESSYFLPGFESTPDDKSLSDLKLDIGIRRLDHVLGNLPELSPVVQYLKKFTGFHEFAEFTGEEIGTEESGLNSVVLANNHENILLVLAEPVYGTKRKSQTENYLMHNEGPGIQHLALASEDIFKTLREMRKRSSVGGFEFMPPPPPTYFKNLKHRAGDLLSDEQIKECEELGILFDKDDQGALLQIFTKPVGDRPTILFEIIQRIGCMVKDEINGKEYQKGGCGGFGKGNITELFKSVEQYEKMLESKQFHQIAAA